MVLLLITIKGFHLGKIKDGLKSNRDFFFAGGGGGWVAFIFLCSSYVIFLMGSPAFGFFLLH